MTLAHVLIGAAFGLGAGVYASALWACTRARGWPSDVVVALLALAGLLYFVIPATPKPGDYAASMGRVAGPADVIAFSCAFIGIAALVFLAASRTGAIARLARVLDRPAADD